MKNFLGFSTIIITLAFVGCLGDHTHEHNGGGEPLPPTQGSPTPSTSATPTPTEAPGSVDTPPPTEALTTPTVSPSPKPLPQNYPFGIVIPGKKGFVKSPYAPYSGDVDVRGFEPGKPVRCPFTNKIFIVPQ